MCQSFSPFSGSDHPFRPSVHSRPIHVLMFFTDSLIHVSIHACVQATRVFPKGQLCSSPEQLPVQGPALAVNKVLS
jgi:hypothetical protein